jgi:hypothetical protein
MKNLLLVFVLLFSGLVFNGCFEKEEKVEKVPRFLQLSREAVKNQKGKYKTAKDWDTEYWLSKEEREAKKKKIKIKENKK